MKLVIVSGSSGSGKSAALQVLEDLGYHCIDNLPLELLPTLLETAWKSPKKPQTMAVSIDARNLTPQLNTLVDLVADLRRRANTHIETLYLDADASILLKRFSATRRKHPLSNTKISLSEAIEQEKELLASLSMLADLKIDTSNLNINELKGIIQERLTGSSPSEFSLMFESFSYREGVPLDADYVFDVRCLPNPHWIPELRELTGKDEAVQAFFEQETKVAQMVQQIAHFLAGWLPAYISNSRRYLTVAIGCTGGQHRSVYVVECLAEHFKDKYKQLLIRHREFNRLTN